MVQSVINNKEREVLVVGLTQLKKNNVVKSWIFENTMFHNMYFEEDKNPEGDADDTPLDADDEWYHLL